MNAARSSDVGFQPARAAVQIDIARTGNMDVSLLARCDVGSATARDVDGGQLRLDLAEIGIPGAGDVDFGAFHFAVGLDRAGAGNAHLDPGLVNILQQKIAAAGDAKFLELLARKNDRKLALIVAPAIAIQLDIAVTNPHMRQSLGIPCHMHFIVVAWSISGMAADTEADMVTAIPGEIAAGGASTGDRFAARPVAQE